MTHRHTVLDEFDGLPLRRFHDRDQAEQFAAGRQVVSAPRQPRKTRRDVVRQALAEVGEAML